MLRYFILNAFADAAHNAVGNPAAICVVDEFPADDFMKEAARRLGQPMNSFIRRTDDPCVFEIRHFTPGGVEDRICGHATLAAVKLLSLLDPALRDGRELTIRLNPRFGISADNAFRVRVNGDDISMVLPAMTVLEPVTDPDFYAEVAAILGVDEDDIVTPALFSPLIENYLLEMKNEATLLKMKPDFTRLRAFGLASEKFRNEGIMTTVRAARPDFDFLGRVFQPVLDVNEDAACGSANCLAIPYWVLKRPEALPPGKTEFRVLFPVNPYAADGTAGGTQTLSMNVQDMTITLTGKATYKHETFPWPHPAPALKPAP